MGGLSGHMMHPHDNLKLTLKDFCQLCARTADGALPTSEKLDGFNIHILNKGGEIRFARNGKDLENAGFGKDEIATRFSNDRVRDIFREGFEMAEKDDRFKMIPDWDLFHYTMNCEIIVGTTNIMPYTDNFIVPHNLFRWEKMGGKYQVMAVDDLPGKLKTNLPLTILDIKPRFNHEYWQNRLFEIFTEVNDNDDTTLEDYYRTRFLNVVMAIMEGEFSLDLVNAMFNRFFGVGEKINLRELRKSYGEPVQKFLDIEKQLVFLTKDALDQFVLAYGTFILEHVRGINWAQTAAYGIAGSINAQVISAIKADPEGTKVFQHRWAACDAKVFATEGIVVEFKGNLYKWTGPFAPINQLLGGNR